MQPRGSTAWRGVCAALLALLLLGATAPDDPLFDRQYHLRRVRAPEAWEVRRGGHLVVAVLDTGVYMRHPDLAGRIVPGIDLVDRGTAPADENGHGTFVAGVVAANIDNGRGGVGVAPRAKIMPVRVLDAEGRGTSDVVAEGIRYATRKGAAVINLSLADVPGQNRPATSLITTDVELAIRQASLDGVVVVCAAGNEGNANTPYSDDLPALIVGATDRRDRVWEHSNYDDRTLFAPGVGIISTYLDDPYAAADGTSFSAPIVSAGAVMLRQHGLTGQQTRRRLAATARPVGEGVGRVDIAAALGVAPRVRSTPKPEPSEQKTQEPSSNDRRPRRPRPVTEPSPVAVTRPKPPTPSPAAVEPVDPVPTVKPRKVARAQPPTPKNRPAPAKTGGAAGDGGVAAPPAADDPASPPWALIIAGLLLFAVVVSLGGYFAARNARSG